MSEELKPCPFCGSSKIKSHDYGNVELLYRCEDCGGEHFHSNWNTRPIEDALQARIAELEWNNSELTDENAELTLRVTEMDQRIKELYADNEALREHYPHFID